MTRPTNSSEKPRRIPAVPLLIFLVLALAVAGAGHFFFLAEKAHLRETAGQNLAAIAELKINQIANWRRERLVDAEVISHNPLNNLRILPFLENPSPGDAGDDIRTWMEFLRQNYDFWDVVLVDAQGRVRLSAGGNVPRLGQHARANIAAVLRTGETVLSDIHRAEGVDIIHLDIYAPLLRLEEARPTPGCGGVLLLRIDPYLFLYPLIQSWPTPSPTAETLIVRRDGEEVLFLNELRHQKNSALSLRFPVNDDRLPAAMAVRGYDGVAEGRDYQGQEVLAAMRRIPDSPWHIVAKIDQEEIFAPLTELVWSIAGITITLVLVMGLSLLLWWKRKEAAFYLEQYEGERKRRTLARQLEYLSRFTNDIILLADHEQKIIEANDRACIAYGYTRDELLGLFLRDLSALDNQPDPQEPWRLAERELGRLCETWHRRKDGTSFPVETSLSIIAVEGKKYYQAVIRDITEQKQAEKERHRLLTQLVQAQKMESIGRLAGGVAHDFNNLLTIILGYSELLLAALPDPSDRESLLQIQKAGERAQALTRQLLAFGRKQVLELKRLDLNRVIADFEKMLKRLIGEDIEVKTVLDPAIAPIMADPAQVEQLLLNLAVNARDAMSKGGLLTIETGAAYLDEDYARGHVGVKPGAYVMLAVSDDGCGMDAETQRQIFEPFFTTKEKGKGTGLGLSTVYGIVKQHRGNIWVYSEPGRGTTFKIYLPRADEDAAVEAAPSPPQNPVVGKGTILVAEDDAAVRNLACRMLSDYGYDVIEARDADEAMRLATERKPIHLLLTDVIMPKMSGRQLQEKIAAIQPGIRVLFMSGYTDNMIAHHGILDAGIHFLQKPFTAQGLTQKIQAALADNAGSPKKQKNIANIRPTH